MTDPNATGTTPPEAAAAPPSDAAPANAPEPPPLVETPPAKVLGHPYTVHTLVFDLETAARPSVAADESAYASENRTPPANYKSPEAIEGWRAKDRAEWANGLGLSPRTGMIVSASCSYVGGDGSVTARTFLTPKLGERRVVANVLELVRRTLAVDEGLVITFNGVAFDLHFLAVRAAVLGVGLPDRYRALTRKHSNAPGVDLYGVLTNWGASARKGDNLKAWARTFGIPVDDESTGADVARLVAERNWADIVKHNEADVRTTRVLFEVLWQAALV